MDIDTLVELNQLWEPVRRYLLQQILELYGRKRGDIIEIGPFSGIVFDLARLHMDATFCLALFPDEILDSFRGEAARLGVEDVVTIGTTTEKLLNIPPESFDLAIFRGAFFFPSLFRPELAAIYRVLRPGGIAIVGGGFGVYTPSDLIESIGKRSAELNKQLGRIRIVKQELMSLVEAEHLEQYCEILEEGGLWVVLRK